MSNLNEKIYRSLYRIRRIEEEVVRVYPTDKVKSPIHLSIGQEAVSVGVCEALRTDDIVFGTYRNHAVYLAKGGDVKKMVAELYGKATGCAKGKGGSMHLVDVAMGVMGGSAVVGTTIPQAVGYAFGLKLQQSDRIVVSFFGDGAVEEGAFHESLNFAALKKLPIIFVCENNFYAIHSRQEARQSPPDICTLARAYGMTAERIENNDVLTIHETITKAVGDLRGGAAGPRFFECMTYRWKEHVGPAGDFQAGYRSYEEARPWVEGDQVKRIGQMIGPEARGHIEKEVETEIAEAFAFAEASPFPEPSELFTDVFA
jgi:TPP-dependent pyruvate/acetoin dehydrogenase alpha subunit